MVRITLLMFAVFLLNVTPALADNTTIKTKDAAKAEPEAIAPGEAVTLRWYFTGRRVLVAGGRFGEGAVVTGRTTLTDHPRKTTRYIFDVWYTGLGTGASRPRSLHTRYQVIVQVDPRLATLAPYTDPHGWQVRVPREWGHDAVPQADEGADGLVYFQPEADSVERMAVAIMPATDSSVHELMRRVRSDIPAHYDDVTVDGPTETLYANSTACWMTFSGMDHTHPGVRTRSIVLAFMRDARAYVISARTDAAHFAAHRVLLERMVKSFTVSGRSLLTRMVRV